MSVGGYMTAAGMSCQLAQIIRVAQHGVLTESVREIYWFVGEEVGTTFGSA